MSLTATTRTATAPRSGRDSVEAARLRDWNHLADYELHHSGTPSVPIVANRHVAEREFSELEEGDEAGPSIFSRALQSPPEWPSHHRRIPAFRPINRELDQSQRRVYASAGERTFLTVMFTGVQTEANLSRMWNATVGRILGDDWFRYKVGGEW
ncbi:hypothetical protein BDV96DRAFT_649871 [Lophiotrema nucula]|uniref:Uncharacterized protein n=1 Tax=Lophiotrema nucula TaxID=690887 RepID=A0A6A5YYJ4_9PLEO|nr:hypothetical protein BDV96DRAFT_649871 [Lophiotrema nucula]